MAKQIWNEPINKSVDWGGDSNTNGLPVSGAMVQKFIKDSLNEKHGASYFEPTTNTMIFFASKEELTEWLSTGDSSLIVDMVEMNFSGTMYQVKVLSEMPSKNLYFTTQMDKAEITVSFLSQKKGITDVSWQDIIEDYYVSVYIDKGGVGAYTPLLLDQLVVNGNTFTFDVRKALATGVNRIRVVAVGTESGTGAQGSEIFIANLTSMYLAPSNFTWYKPFIEGDTYSLGGLNIGGNLQKILKIRVSKEGYEKLYEVNIGSDIYTTTAYVFQGMQFPEAGTGVYNVEMWLDANGLESDHLSYNIICVSQADKFSAQLVAIGNPAKVVYNFSDNTLFQYSVYNGGTATGSPHIKVLSIVSTNPTTLIDEDLVNVATASPLSYTASLEIEMEDEAISLQIEAQLSYGNEQVIIFPVDNSKSYPATTGAVFYMNPSARNNAQDNREKIINAINSAEIGATFKRMSWADGTDGWTTDDNGRKCLNLPAMSGVEIDYKPLESVKQKTIELVYKVKNAAEYDEPIISICSDVNDPQFRGIKITPKNILIHSRDLNVEDSLQDYNTIDEETLHVLITIIPNYKTNYGNLAQIYCNGDKVRSFSFETADRWDVASNIFMGSETADLYVYKMRVYDRGFESYDALKNYVNSLPSTAEKELMANKIEGPLNDSYKLSYDDCVKNGLNTMVIEILDQDQTVPSITKPSAKQCNLWIKIHNPENGELDEDFTYLFGGNDILNQTIEGQGTTAMTYARWNFRWKLGEEYNKRRITAKKNVASSMHSHKMGATRLFNDLNRKIVGANDANGRVAVFQYPVYGFQKILIEGTNGQYMYEPIGLYTIGPDKGDKNTFGFGNKTYKNTLVHMEGTDHTPKGVGMDYPWDELRYSGAAEGFGAVNASGGVIAAWEVGAAGPYDPADEPDETMSFVTEEFRPAYDVAYNNSTYIEGVAETLPEINANVNAWQVKVDAEGRSYSGLEFFTDGVYDIYYYNSASMRYEPNGINLLTDLGVSSSEISGLTLAQKTEFFKQKRRERFVATWGTYWNTQDSIFHYTFVLLFGATDNFKKNTYPYKFKAVAEGGKWRWRSDDLDTLFDINNQGLAAKTYSILVGDKTSTGSGSIYRGDTSVFWTLIKETQQTAIKSMVHAIFDTMVSLCPSSYGNNTLDKLVGCVRYYFWDKAQAYFPASAYNMDAEWTYEDTWAAGLYKEVNPLSQSLGGHYEAERDWVTMRILFTAMYYNYGPFGAVNDSFSDTSTGQIAYGGAGAHTFAIVMACDGNPTILRGQSELVTKGERVMAGETVELTVPDSSGADTRIYVQGVDWMEDVGDLSTLQVSADNPLLSVSSKRMQTFKLGDEDASKVTTNVSSLSFGDCPSMMSVDVRNVSTLGGNIDLTKMPRLQEAYFGGTKVRSITLHNGSKITKFEVGEELTQLALMNLMFLKKEDFGHGTLPKLEFLRIENCGQLSPYQLLKDIYNLDGNVLRDIRVIGFDESGDWRDFSMLANIASDRDKDGNAHVYNGIDSEGNPIDDSYPIIEGKLSTEGNIYEDDYAYLTEAYPNLQMQYNELYLRLKDQEVLKVFFAHGLGDGIAITVDEAENLISVYGWFANNQNITTFDEFGRFKKVVKIEGDGFRSCTSLSSIDLSNITSITSDGFNGCSSLTGEYNLPSLETMGSSAFKNTQLISFIAPNLTGDIGATCFGNCSLLKIVEAPLVSSIGTYAFSGCNSLSYIDISGAKTIQASAFRECSSLETVDITNAEEIGGQAFYNCTSLSGELLTNKLKSCSDNAFQNCVNLEKVDLSNTTRVSYQAFDGCSSLRDIVSLENATALGAYVFRNCASLSMDIYIPKVASLAAGEFQKSGITALDAPLANVASVLLCENCPSLKRVSMEKAEKINIYSFNTCTSLEEAAFPNLKTMDTNAFVGCTSLHTITMPNIESIGGYAFRGCTSLKGDMNLSKLKSLGIDCFRLTSIFSFVAPLLETIGDSVFHTCKSLKKVELSNVTSIGSYVFYGCSSLEEMICRMVTPPSIGALSLDSTNNCPIYVPASSIPSYAAATNWSTYASRLGPLEDHEDGGWVKFEDPAVEAICVANWDTNGSGYMSGNECAAVKELASGIFRGNSEITSFDELKEFKNLATIQGYAFENCTNLESVYLENVKKLGDYTFRGCSSLKGNINIPELTGWLGVECFTETSIDSFNAPNVTDSNITVFRNCLNLKSISLENILNIRNSFAYGCTSLEYVYIPNCNKIWNNAFQNCTSLKSIEMPSIEVIGSQSFDGCSSLSININFPILREIGSQAFRNSGVVSIVAPNISLIDMFAFDGCSSLEYFDFTNLETINIGAFRGSALAGKINAPKLQTCGQAAFASCKNITSFYAPNLISFKGPSAFEQCTSLVSVNMPYVANLPNNTFASCQKLESISLANIEVIGDYVFYNCKNLQYANMSKVTSIGQWAFVNCLALQYIVIDSITPPTLGNNAFLNTSCPIYVPDASVDAYKAATNWTTYAGRIKPLSEYNG